MPKAAKAKSINWVIVVILLAAVAIFVYLATRYSVQNKTIADNTSVYAAKGGGKPGGGAASITLNQTDPHLGDWVTFTSSGGKMIELTCYGDSLFDVIYTAYQAPGTSFLLGGTSSVWLSRGGPAYCSALLYNRLSSGPLASTYFNAGGVR